MTLRQRIAQWLLAPTEKASTGIGVAWYMNGGQPLSSLIKDPRKQMAQAQAIGIANLYIRAAERVIGDRFSTVEWHLEDQSGEEMESGPVHDLLERPYRPQPGDPASATPQTRSALWRITSRHMGVAGNAFWYLDRANVNGWPLSLLYINPARMSPAEDSSGNLLGWVLDKDVPGGGMPLERDQVLHFRLEPPDAGHYGIGLVESAIARADLIRLSEHHAREVLASGGRLPGVFSPPPEAGAIPEDQYEQLKKDLRTITEVPDAARRSLILRGPIEFTKTVGSPSELDLNAIAVLGRDGILDLWGVPLSQLSGVGAPSGLGSETRKYDEASLWQNAVGPRLRAFSEVLQFQLLDRLDPAPQLIIEEPEFDDEAPAYDLAAKAISLPLTNAQRLEMVGLEPTGDDAFDNAVWLPINLTQVWTVGAAEPEPEPVPPVPPFDEAKARAIPGVDRIRSRMTSGVRREVDRLIDEMCRDVSERVRKNAKHLAAKPTDDSVWWDEAKWQQRFEAIMKPIAALAAETTHDRTRDLLGTPQKADLRDIVLTRLLGDVGARIRGILGTTRDKVRKTIAQGIADGLGAAELGDLVEQSSGFGEYRAEMIARTETNRVLNLAQVETYKEFGVSLVQVIDGDEDAECIERQQRDNGWGPGIYTVEQAAGIEDHPNGTLDWMPLTLTMAPRAPVA